MESSLDINTNISYVEEEGVVEIFINLELCVFICYTENAREVSHHICELN
jgi:hypothetical protein